jgi:hypothetical protein
MLFLIIEAIISTFGFENKIQTNCKLTSTLLYIVLTCSPSKISLEKEKNKQKEPLPQVSLFFGYTPLPQVIGLVLDISLYFLNLLKLQTQPFLGSFKLIQYFLKVNIIFGIWIPSFPNCLLR